MSLNFNGINIGGVPSGGGGGGSYVLPIASTETLGGVKIDGETITITNEGVISSSGGGSVTPAGSVTQPVYIAQDGTPTATTYSLSKSVPADAVFTDTTDHSQLTNLDYANSGHTGFMSNDNYIPANTTITVKQDGTGDFTNLLDAVASLVGKWSDGIVTISIAAGTYNLTERVLIRNSEFNIPYLQIVGNSYTDTIINTTATNAGIYFQNGGLFLLSNITLNGSNAGTGLAADNVYLVLDAVVITKFATGISTLFAKVQLGSPINIQNCSVGINSARFAQVTSNASSAISFNTVTTAWSVEACGFIAPLSGNILYTNVTNKASQTVGTLNSNGFIGGTITN